MGLQANLGTATAGLRGGGGCGLLAVLTHTCGRTVFGIEGIFRGKFSKPQNYPMISRCIGGEGGIRTHGGLAPTAVFKTAALDRSATHPREALPCSGAVRKASRGR